MVNVGVFSPFILLGFAVHVSTITACHYVASSPLIAAVAFVFTILDLYILLFKKRQR